MDYMIIVKSGYIDVMIQTAINKKYVLQRLYPGCSYGSLCFFTEDNSENRLNKFEVVGATAGTYIKLTFKDLLYIAIHNETMMRLMLRLRRLMNIGDEIFPLCDFSFPDNGRDRTPTIKLKQAMRKVILFNKQKRSKVKSLIENEKERNIYR